MLPDFACRSALLLQGPAGPFFRRFAEELRAAGVAVTKVNLHAGDELFFGGPDAVPFRGHPDDWPAFLESLMVARGVDGVFLFGDSRPYHRTARRVADALGVTAWVFEEGYLRPDYITLERGGVNGNSSLPRDPAFYASHEGASRDPEPTSGAFLASAVYSALNALAFTHLNRGYPHYEHHRDLNAWRHVRCWVTGAVRKLTNAVRERDLAEQFTTTMANRYFLVPLQVFCDYQLIHSPYHDVRDFIVETVREFALHADPNDAIVFKHHPMDRPFRDYADLMSHLGARYGMGERLWYVHDLHLPTLLKNAKGTITINSTVGLSSIHHRTPVKTLGTAVYDLPGLTFQGDLRAFLQDPGVVDADAYRSFRRYLERHNQANGSFYRRNPGRPFGTGVRWWTELERES